MWAFFFLTLPVTSFPFFPPGIGGATLVRPLAIYPLFFLVLLFTLPRLVRRGLPRSFLPLLGFFLAATISSSLAFSSDLELLRGIGLSDRFFRNMATLGLGLAFYLTVSLLHDNWKDLEFSLRWLYTGFGIALAWGSLQSLYVLYYVPAYFRLLNQIQALISTRKLFPTRISGMTYEPKWFAEQISFLLLPWLIGAVLTRRSVFPWRYKWITVESLLLVWAMGVLIFTYSRTGLAILALLAILSYLLLRSGLASNVRRQSPVKSGPANRWKRLQLMTELAVIAGLLAGGFYIAGSQNPYFSRFWRYFTEAKQRNKTYFEYIAVQSRFVYWETALRIFDEYPLMGVGLGNYAFYFDEMLPNQPWNQQPEIVRQITPVEGRDRLITPKNLPGRLLAETGLLGTFTFAAFFIAILGSVLYLWFSASGPQHYWAISGFLALVVFLVVIFSFDSFAVPNMWIVFGLITAAGHLPDPSAQADESRVE
jgi:hypothetical protein